MKTVQFLSNSPKIDNIVKGFTLTKSLFVSSLLIGEPYTGKKTLIKSLFPDALYIDATHQDELLLALEKHEEIVIYNFEKLLNFEELNFENHRIIAIANHIENSIKIEKKFAFIYHMPTIEEREDFQAILEHFKDKIQDELMITQESHLEVEQLDLSQNIKSLRASIYRQLVNQHLSQSDIESILYRYLLKHLHGNNAYRDNISLFERPLIQAGLALHKSQLKLSSVLGLNRNTLRKKIHEHGLD